MQNGLALEGTGSLVLDRKAKLAYLAISSRSNVELAKHWCNVMKYECIPFHSLDENQNPIYHSNVILSIGEQLAFLVEESIPNSEDLYQVKNHLKLSGKKIISLNFSQMRAFAANCLELKNNRGEALLVCSQQAYAAYTNEQIQEMEKQLRILAIEIPTIEHIAGGGIRCMMAEIFPSLVK